MMRKKKYKRYALVLFVLSMSSPQKVLCQNNNDYRSVQNGSWNDHYNWEVFSAGSWTPSVSAPTQLAGSIQVRNNLLLNADHVMDQVQIDTGSSLIILPGVTVTITNSSDPIELSVKGQIINSGMLFFSPSAIMKIDSGGTYIHNSSVASSAVLNSTQLDQQSTWIYRGNGTLAPPISFSGRTYGHLAFESSAGNWNRTVTGTSTVHCSSLRIDANVMLINNATAILNIHGDLVLNGALVNGQGFQSIIMDGMDAKLCGTNLNNFFDRLLISAGSTYSLKNNLGTSPYSTFIIEGKLNCESNIISGNTNGSSFNLLSGAWLNTSNAGGVISCISDFDVMNLSDSANYEFSGNNFQSVCFHKSIMHDLKINANSQTLLTLKNSMTKVLGTLLITEGTLSIDTNTLELAGGAIQGNTNNLISNANSSLIFTGSDSAVFIPASVQVLKMLKIDKSAYEVHLTNDLNISEILILQNRNLVTDTHNLIFVGNTSNGIISAGDSSYVNGNLVLKLPVNDSINCSFPIGREFYQPIHLNHVQTYSTTNLKACVYESIPTGTSDSISLEGYMNNRFYQMKTLGTNGIISIDEISIKPSETIPIMTSGSKIGFSKDNSRLSFHGMGGILSSGTLTSTRAISPCEADDLGSFDGSYIGIAYAKNQDGVFSDSSCTNILQLKLFIQGFYIGNKKMQANIDPISFPDLCDTLIVEFHSSDPPFEMVYQFTSTINTWGNILLDIKNVMPQNYYFVIKHRNSLESWTALPISLSDSIKFFDLSIANQIYGNNSIELEPGVFGLYTGDINQIDSLNPKPGDGKIDTLDFITLEESISEFLTGYNIQDLTGDGIIDLADYSLLENNVELNLELRRPW